jgi:hypothetical protein
MILDAFLQFDSSNNLAQIAGTYNSTNVIDLGGPGIPVLASGQGARDIGIGDNPAMKLLVQVTTTFTSGGAGTLAVNLQGAADNGSGAPLTFTTWYTTPTYALATLVVGGRLMDMDMPRPPDGIPIPRFLRLTYVIGGATMTAGTVEALIILDRMDQYYTGTNNAVMSGYPAGITVAN